MHKCTQGHIVHPSTAAIGYFKWIYPYLYLFAFTHELQIAILTCRGIVLLDKSKIQTGLKMFPDWVNLCVLVSVKIRIIGLLTSICMFLIMATLCVLIHLGSDNVKVVHNEPWFYRSWINKQVVNILQKKGSLRTWKRTRSCHACDGPLPQVIFP